MKWEEKEKKFGKPVKGEFYLCKLVNSHSKTIVEAVLNAKYADDHLWVTADDGSEIDEWNWDVIEWTLTTKPKK